jgi:HEAT repeat protein
MNPPAEDTRTTAELFEAALHLATEEARWDAVCALHWRGSREVFDRAVELCQSPAAEERALAADVLGQLGVPERSFAAESFAAVLPLLRDSSADVLNCAIVALQHIDQDQAAAHILPFREHPDEDVRYAVTYALCGVATEQAIEALLALTRDPDEEVRIWATFGLGQQSDLDTPQIREALAARLEDPSEEVRCEAVIGLARRGDMKMAGSLAGMLRADPDFFAIEAATMLLGIEDNDDPDPGDLLEALERQQASL